MKKLVELTEMELVKPFYGLTTKNEVYSNATHIFGFCFDGTTSFRPGARFGPDAIRDASFGLESYSSYQDRDLEDYESQIIDCGNLPIYPSKWEKTNSHFEKMLQSVDLKETKTKIVTLGGEHSISYGPIKKYMQCFEDLFIIHLDAHADLRDGYLDEKYSHASIIRRIWDHKKETQELIQYGIRSGTRDEFRFMEKYKTRALSLNELLEKVKAVADTRPIYMTLDLDYFDPAYFPGTGTPEAGGEDFHAFIRLIKILKTKNFVGADIVELAPMLDATGNSSAFASKVTRETLLALQD
jgi:agmatinase